MTPFRLRLFVAGFLLLAATIVTNALYMQKAPHLVAATAETPQTGASGATPTAALADATPAAAETAPAVPAAAEEKPAQPAEPVTVAVHEPVRMPPLDDVLPAPTPLAKNIQRELTLRGYTTGRQDGVLSRECRAAILAYEFDEKLPLSGEASEAVLKTLIFARASGIKSKPGAAERFEARRDLIEQAQQMLAQYGYTSGPVDGALDTKTRDAIRKFETDRRLKPSGYLTERVLLEMVIISGRPFPANG